MKTSRMLMLGFAVCLLASGLAQAETVEGTREAPFDYGVTTLTMSPPIPTATFDDPAARSGVLVGNRGPLPRTSCGGHHGGECYLQTPNPNNIGLSSLAGILIPVGGQVVVTATATFTGFGSLIIRGADGATGSARTSAAFVAETETLANATINGPGAVAIELQGIGALTSFEYRITGA